MYRFIIMYIYLLVLVPVVSFVDANASYICCLSCVFETIEYLEMYSYV